MNENTSNIESEELGYLTTIARGANIDIAGKIVNAGLRYLYMLILARYLGAGSLGILSLAVVIIEFFGVISRLGLESGILKYVSIYNAEGDQARLRGMILKTLQVTGLTSVFLAILLFLFVDFIAISIFKKPELALVLKIMTFALPLSTIMYILNNVTQAFHTMKYRTIVESFMNPILNLGLVCVLLYIGFGLEHVAYVYVITSMICIIFSSYYTYSMFPQILRIDLKPKYETRSWLRFSSPLLLVHILGLLLLWTDTLMIGYFRTSAEVGIYNIAIKSSYFINFILIAFTSIFTPRISELFKMQKIEKLGLLYKTVSKWTIALSAPIFLIIVLLSRDILSLFGEQFVDGKLSLIILSFGSLVNVAVGSVAYLLIMTEHEKVVTYSMIGMTLLNIVLNYFLIPPFGYLGAAITSSFSTILYNLILLFQVIKYLKINPFSKGYLIVFCASVIVIFFKIILSEVIHLNSEVHRLVFHSIIYLSIYFLFVAIFLFDKNDKIVMESVLRKIQ